MRRSLQTLAKSYRSFSTAAPASLESIVHPDVSNLQLEYLKETCIAVDENDKVLGPISKASSHQIGTATLHRAFSVLIFNSKKEMLLQKRSMSKITFPNCWTNACCSHPNCIPEESIEENALGVRRAAQRKLHHELGISKMFCDLSDFNLVGRFIYTSDSDDYWCEKELDYVLILKNFSGRINLNPDEVSEAKFVDPQTLTFMMNSNSQSFSPWFRLLYEQGWIEKWWKNLDNLTKFSNPSKITKLNE